MITFRIERTKKAKVPDIIWPRSFLDKVARVAEGSTLDNIKRQKTRDGARLKQNAPATRERKRRKGRPRLSLVDEQHRFVKGRGSSWKVLRYLRNGVVIGGATADLRKLVHYVVNKGYVGWLGLNRDGVLAIKALIREEVKAMFRKAKK